MSIFEMDYRLISFEAVKKGDVVHRGTRAMAPGYFAKIEVKVLDAHIPLVGQQELWIPMAYYAVANSQEF